MFSVSSNSLRKLQEIDKEAAEDTPGSHYNRPRKRIRELRRKLARKREREQVASEQSKVILSDTKI